jgi:hypothetical protein
MAFMVLLLLLRSFCDHSIHRMRIGCASDVEGNDILATQVSNQDTAVLLHYP